MNKEEILNKSRQEKSDEGMLHAENLGRQYGFAVFSVVFAFIVIFNLFHGQSNYAPFAMFWAYCATESYYKYAFTKKKSFLATSVFGAVAAAASLVSFILETLR